MIHFEFLSHSTYTSTDDVLHSNCSTNDANAYFSSYVSSNSKSLLHSDFFSNDSKAHISSYISANS